MIISLLMLLYHNFSLKVYCLSYQWDTVLQLDINCRLYLIELCLYLDVCVVPTLNVFTFNICEVNIHEEPWCKEFTYLFIFLVNRYIYYVHSDNYLFKNNTLNLLTSLIYLSSIERFSSFPNLLKSSNYWDLGPTMAMMNL